MKRFYDTVSSVSVKEGFEVHLDGRPVRTPAKRRLALPGEGLAQAISREWSDQGEDLDTHGMRLTRLANGAIDRIADCRDPVVSEIAGYAETDLVCYRAAEPEALRRRQETGWTPLVDWIERRHEIVLTVTTELLPSPQPAESLAKVRKIVEDRNDFRLAGLQLAVAASGSIVIALALAEGEIDASRAWELSLVDETWQIENWGEDPEAAKRRADLLADIDAAETFMKLSEETERNPRSSS